MYIHEISRDNLEIASKQLWEFLKPRLSYLSQIDLEQVEIAFMQMVEAHQEQRRKSGEYYIIHPASACITLADMKLDRDTLIAVLLHDVPEDTEVSLRELEKIFSREVIFLISGVTKLSSIKYQGEDRYAENLRRMFVAMSRDIRVIFIKLADRLHNLETLDALPPEKARRIALESLEIYAPIAERLGMGKFQDRLENLSFPYAYPQEYKALVEEVKQEYDIRQNVLEHIQKNIEHIFDQENITNIKIYGRAKKYYSLYKKLGAGKTVDEVYDLIALRIITKDIASCYQVFSVIQSHFEPLENRVKDYIAKPKDNGYQSIHTTVRDKGTGTVFELQIRTEEMHEYCEYGVASHWSYKQKSDIETHSFIDTDKFKWIQDLVNLGKEPLSEEEYLQYVKLDLFQDQIFVMTPKGDAIRLIEGATALDFAFRIHQDIGRHASLAKVNGSPVKLSENLKNGDIVEIITDKKQKPHRDWLNMVKTPSAARTIRNNLRKQGVKLG
jgi:GTP diphosphokinase / guanosine-3',5'-bis(diphosphate) 3'-diphosphatase